MENLIDITSYPVAPVLNLLLQEKAAKKNIIWATDTYEDLGEGFTDKAQMHSDTLLQRPELIRPRIQKPQETQTERTRKKAEVFTPAWLCNRMNNYCDDDWFGRGGVFNTENNGHTWTVSEGKIEFPKGKTWQRYVDSRRLEITCGEAPYLVSRYDVATGTLIVPPIRRIGILDRKLRIVDENTDTYEDWLKWTVRAFEASYGYEYQGDNVLIARINLLLTFTDYYEERWKRQPDTKLLRQMANKIAWNIWQMDGLKDTAPLGKPYDESDQLTFFDALGIDPEKEDGQKALPCGIFNWRRKTSIRFRKLKETRAMGKKLFDYVIGNPPYNEDFENSGDNGNYAKPVYNYFMDAAYEVAYKVELIHPARFLFNAGSTPKEWNNKMLNDEHFKILNYEANSKNVFSNTDIKGGVAISYRDDGKNYGAIGTFTSFEELNSILKKVCANPYNSLNKIIYASESYKFTDYMHEVIPEAEKKLSKGHKYDFKTSVLSTLDNIVFFDNKPADGDYVQILGLINSKRVYKWIRRNFISGPDNFEKYKVFVPAANGSGALGEVLSTPLIGQPLIGQPLIGHTQTFISIGCFDKKQGAENLLKYIKTKFCRIMLGVLKVTQHNPAPKWKYVPLQDFTPPPLRHRLVKVRPRNRPAALPKVRAG